MEFTASDPTEIDAFLDNLPLSQRSLNDDGYDSDATVVELIKDVAEESATPEQASYLEGLLGRIKERIATARVSDEDQRRLGGFSIVCAEVVLYFILKQSAIQFGWEEGTFDPVFNYTSTLLPPPQEPVVTESVAAGLMDLFKYLGTGQEGSTLPTATSTIDLFSIKGLAKLLSAFLPVLFDWLTKISVIGLTFSMLTILRDIRYYIAFIFDIILKKTKIDRPSNYGVKRVFAVTVAAMVYAIETTNLSMVETGGLIANLLPIFYSNYKLIYGIIIGAGGLNLYNNQNQPAQLRGQPQNNQLAIDSAALFRDTSKNKKRKSNRVTNRINTSFAAVFRIFV